MGNVTLAGTVSPGSTTLAATLASALGVHMVVNDAGAVMNSACPQPE